MSNLDKLQLERIRISGAIIKCSEDIDKAELDLESSFLGEGSVDRISALLTDLISSRGVLSSTLKALDAAIIKEQSNELQSVVNERTVAKREALKKALEAIDEASDLGKKLSVCLQVAMKETVITGTGVDSDLSNGIRKIIGNIITATGINSVSLRSTTHLQAISSEDYNRLNSNIREI